MPDRIKVLLDTDIGSDIDDAIALAYLLAQPACELLGITTVSGQGVQRAMMCSALCEAAGADVPIYPGVEHPLLVEPRQPDAPQAAALGNWKHRTEFPAGQAIEFLRRTIRANPGQVVLLTIGPLTNAALLFATDAEAAGLLKALVMMCGVFTNRLPGSPAREWNALNDPHATAIAYAACPPVHRSIGLDVTRQVTMKADEVRRRFRTGLLRPVLDFAEVWFKGRPAITFHDPLAAATIFDDGLCRFERGRVRVELASPDFAGATLWRADPAGGPQSPRGEVGGPGPHEAAMAVDGERFFEHYFSVF